MLGASKVPAEIAALVGDDASAPVVVVEDVRLAHKLTKLGVPVLAVCDSDKKLRKYDGDKIVGPAVPLPVDDGAAAAVVGAVPSDDAESVYADWLRATRDGGMVIALAKRVTPATAGQLLCGGLTDIRERAAGRATMLVGTVRKY